MQRGEIVGHKRLHTGLVALGIQGQRVLAKEEFAQALSRQRHDVVSVFLQRTALTHGIPYYTTVAGARAAVQAIAALRQGCLEVAPLQSYL